MLATQPHQASSSLTPLPSGTSMLRSSAPCPLWFLLLPGKNRDTAGGPSPESCPSENMENMPLLLAPELPCCCCCCCGAAGSSSPTSSNASSSVAGSRFARRSDPGARGRRAESRLWRGGRSWCTGAFADTSCSRGDSRVSRGAPSLHAGLGWLEKTYKGPAVGVEGLARDGKVLDLARAGGRLARGPARGGEEAARRPRALGGRVLRRRWLGFSRQYFQRPCKRSTLGNGTYGKVYAAIVHNYRRSAARAKGRRKACSSADGGGSPRREHLGAEGTETIPLNL